MVSLLADSPPELSWFALYTARHPPNSGSAWGSRVERFGGAQQFPSQVVHVKNEDRVGEHAPELFRSEHCTPPAELRERLGKPGGTVRWSPAIPISSGSRKKGGSGRGTRPGTFHTDRS